MSTHTLKQKRTPIVEELRTISAAGTAAGALTEDQGKRVDELRTQLAAVDREIGLAELIETEERRSQGTLLHHGSGDAGFDQLASQVCALDICRAQMGGTDAACGRAREVSAEIERRSGRRAEGLFFDMRVSGARPERRVFTTTTPSGGPGSALIETEVSPNIIDRLRERIIVRSLGAVVLAGLQGNLSIPRLKASATGYWVAENTAITASDPQTDAVGLTPHHVGGLVEVSRNMIMQPSIDVTRLFEDDLAKIIAVALDQAALVGGGSNQPSGLLASGSGIGSVAMGTNGGDPTWNAVIALIGAVGSANALTGSLAFATNAKAVSKMRRVLRTSADTASTFIMEGPTQLAGYPLASSQSVPSNLTKGTSTTVCSPLIFGDWSMLVLGFWSELDILVNPYESTAYPKGNVQVRAMATADVGIRQPLAFSAIQDLTTV
jgi:HK97 family phage major capsid protein